MDVYNILGLGELDCTVAMIKNADSVKMGKIGTAVRSGFFAAMSIDR